MPYLDQILDSRARKFRLGRRHREKPIEPLATVCRPSTKNEAFAASGSGVGRDVHGAQIDSLCM